MDSLITLLCVVGAVVALVLAARSPQHRATLCFTALGALLAIPVTRALAPQSQLPSAPVPSSPLAQESRSADPRSDGFGAINSFDEPSPPAARRRSSHSSDDGGVVEHVAEAPRGEAPAEDVGGTEIAVRGSWAGADLESALLSALQDRAWSGLSHGGRKRLFVSGAVHDLEPILGQLSAATVSARWELRSASGTLLAQGAASDTRGRGTDESDARLAAVTRAAAEIASQVTSGAP